MPVSWRWRLVVALVGIALFLGHSGVAAKIERFKDKEGTLHISNTGELPIKPGGATTPNSASTPAPTPAPTAAPAPQPTPPAPRLVPVPPPPEQVAPPPPGDPVEAPPVMEPEPNEQQLEPPEEQRTSEAGNDGAGQPPPVPHIPGQRGRGRGVLVR